MSEQQKLRPSPEQFRQFIQLLLQRECVKRPHNYSSSAHSDKCLDGIFFFHVFIIKKTDISEDAAPQNVCKMFKRNR